MTAPKVTYYPAPVPYRDASRDAGALDPGDVALVAREVGREVGERVAGEMRELFFVLAVGGLAWTLLREHLKP